MADFIGNIAGQAFGVADLDGLADFVKVRDWHMSEDGIQIRANGDYLFWGASMVAKPRIVPYELVPGADGSLVERPPNDPIGFLREMSGFLKPDGSIVLMVNAWEKLAMLVASRLTVTSVAWSLETMTTNPGRSQAGKYEKQEGRF